MRRSGRAVRAHPGAWHRIRPQTSYRNEADTEPYGSVSHETQNCKSLEHRISSAVCPTEESEMIRKLKSGEYRLYSKKTDPKPGKRRNLGTFPPREGAEKHERGVQYFKRH